jgi:deoxycytidine triphosphate deaminase
MLVSADEIRLRHDQGDAIISPITQEELAFIEGSSPNLSVSKLFLPTMRMPIIGKLIRRTCELREVKPQPFNDPPYSDYLSDLTEEERGKLTEGWVLSSGCFAVIQTVESVDLRRKEELPDLKGYLWRRVTSFLCGTVVLTGAMAPGFSGQSMLAIYVPAFCPGLALEKGAGIAALHLHSFGYGEETDLYAGVYGGSKTQTDGIERGT